ncbi:MAG: TetR family transcriptional regulator [Mycolicibacterium cosmeticum]|nr:TetR family transcriptional regulator [Mycolicibacterium cosmeticum]
MIYSLIMRSEDVKPLTFIQAARRAQIVTSAIEVVAEIGWTKTSIRKIADRVGVAMSAVLYHFGTKDKLVDAIIEAMYRAALEVVRPALEAETTAQGKLAAYIRSNIAYFDTNRVHLLALTQISANFSPTDGRRFDELGMSAELGEQLAALDPGTILAAGQRDGEFGEFPTESMAVALRGAVNAVVEKILREPDFDATTYGEDLVAIFARAVGAPR